MASFERCAIDENGNLVKITIGGDTELVLTGSCVLATSATAPPGTLIADGSEVSREAYAKLFAIFGESQGAGDGVTTFNLPDWRDEFLRFSGASRAVLTTQGDAIRDFSGTLGFRYGALYGSSGVFSRTEYAPNATTPTVSAGLSPTDTVAFSASHAGVPTADENRPRNVAFLPCVIYV